MSLFRERESSLQTKVVNLAKKRGWRGRKISSPGHRGVADFMFTKKPRRIKFVEFKRDDDEDSTPIQKYEQRLLREEGFEVYQIDDIEDAYAIFD